MFDIAKGVKKDDRTVDRILEEVERFIVARDDVASYYQGVPKGTSQGNSRSYESQGYTRSQDSQNRGFGGRRRKAL